MNQLTIVTWKRIFLFALLGTFLFGVGQASSTTVRADDCRYVLNLECDERIASLLEEQTLLMLTRYFVKGHDEDDCLYFDDVKLWTRDASVLDSVADPVRDRHPNLRQYNHLQLLRGRGELWEWDLDDAKNSGNAVELPNSRIRLVTYCAGLFQEPDPREGFDPEWPPESPPWEIFELEIGEMGGYGRLHALEEPIDNASAAERELVPEGLYATFLLVHADDAPYVEELFGQE